MMLSAIFLGLEIRILDELKRCPVEIIGVYLPPAPYWVRRYAKFFPFSGLTKQLKTAEVYGQLFEFLQLHTIKDIRSQSVNDVVFVERLKKLNPDIGIVANFGQILSPSLLRIPRYGFFNYHPSLLPHHRGPRPFEEILADADQVSGITWHRMTEKVDQGDILIQESFPVNPFDDIQDLDFKAIQLAKKTLGQLLADIENGRASPRPQRVVDAAFIKEHPQSKRRG